MPRVTFKQLDAFCAPAHHLPPHLADCMAEIPPRMLRWLRLHGLSIDGAAFHYEPSHFAAIEAVVNAVMAEYDAGADMPTWKLLGLRSDDDGDNASFINALVEALRTWHEQNGG